MDLDDFAKGAVASLLTDQVDAKAGLVTKISWGVVLVAGLMAVFTDGVLRWFAVSLALAGLALLLFVFVTKRLALGIIYKLAPRVDLANARQPFDTAIAAADLPTGPVAFLRLIWRLRKGVGPEVERLGSVATQLRTALDGDQRSED